MSVDREQRIRPSSVAGLNTLFSKGSLTGLSDGRLIEAFLDHYEPQLAFAMIVERHGGMVLRTCRSILRNEADAEDALQVTFLVLARKAPSLRNRASLAAWLHAVATRTANAARRNSARRRFIEANAAVPSETNAPETNDDLREHIQNEVARLPERLREVVVLREFEGLSEGEVAGQIGCAEGTVKSRLFRARKRLKVRLEARGWDATAILAPSTLPFSLPANAAAAISLLSMSEGPSIPARLALWRSMVLKGMLMKKLQTYAAITLFVSVSLGSSALVATAGGHDEPKPTASSSTESAQSAEQDRLASLFATLAKTQLALAEALHKEQLEFATTEAEPSQLVEEAEDQLLTARFALAQVPSERISILRQRLRLASLSEERDYSLMEKDQGAKSKLRARISTLHRLAIATELAREEMAKPASIELLRKTSGKDIEEIRTLLNQFEASDQKHNTEEIMAMTIQLPKREQWILNEFLIAWREASIKIQAPGIPIEVEGASLTDLGLSIVSPVACPDGPLTFAEYLKKVLDPLGLKYSLQNALVYIDVKGPKKEREKGVPPHNFSIFPTPR